MIEPPANGQYTVAAYVVATLILAGYAAGLVRRVRRTLRRDGER
jgi:hypothetical protein